MLRYIKAAWASPNNRNAQWVCVSPWLSHLMFLAARTAARSDVASQKLCLQRIHFAVIVISLRLDDIANGYNADQSALIHNRQMTNTHFGHGISHRHQVILWYRGDDLSSHHCTHVLGKYRFVHRCRPNDVALREDPDQLSGVIQDN